MCLYEVEQAGVDWIHLTQDKEQCWVLVNMVMDYRLYRYQQMHYSKHIVYFNITS